MLGLQDKQDSRVVWDPRVTWGPGAWPSTEKWLVDLSSSENSPHSEFIPHCCCWAFLFQCIFLRVQLVLEEKKETLDVLENGFVKTAQKKKKSKTKENLYTKQVSPTCVFFHEGFTWTSRTKRTGGSSRAKGHLSGTHRKKTGKHARFSLALFLILLFSRESEGWKETLELLAWLDPGWDPQSAKKAMKDPLSTVSKQTNE